MNTVIRSTIISEDDHPTIELTLSADEDLEDSVEVITITSYLLPHNLKDRLPLVQKLVLESAKEAIEDEIMRLEDLLRSK